MSIPPYLEQLDELLRIPSISTDGEHAHDLRRAAGWLSRYLQALDFETSLVETDGPPLLLAEHRSAGPDRPTALIYGHYDVQPPDPVEAWTTPPFEPAVRDGRLYARGATDDKGQLLVQLKAIEALATGDGGLPVNVVVLVEGEEEVGSGGALRWVEEHGGEVGADVVLISDSNLWSEDRPAIITGFRGITYLEVRVTGPARDLHSGVYGGAVVNPVNALVRMLAGLQDDDWRVNASGFYDPVHPLDDELRSRLPSDLDEARLVAETGVPAAGGESGFSLAERLWYRPTLDINGIVGGFGGDGVKTVIPAAATAKLSSRLVPGQRPEPASRTLESRLRELAPEEVAVDVAVLSASDPWRARTDHFAYRLAAEALSEAFPEPAVFAGDGGSLPIVPALEAATGAPVVPMGFGVPGANPHAPDEWLSLEAFERGVRAVASFHERLGAH